MKNYKIDIYDESPLYGDIRNPVILIAEINIMTNEPLEPFIIALKNAYPNFKFYIYETSTVSREIKLGQ